MPTTMYRDKTWNMEVSERKKLSVMERSCLRSMNGVTLTDRGRNNEMQRIGVMRKMVGQAGQGGKG